MAQQQMFDSYNRSASQQAPGRDVEELDEYGNPKKREGDIQSAVMGTNAQSGVPQGGTQLFNGARQTTQSNIQSAIGAAGAATGGDIGQMFAGMQKPGGQAGGYGNGNTGIAGGMQTQGAQPQAQPQNPSPTAGLAQAPPIAPPQGQPSTQPPAPPTAPPAAPQAPPAQAPPPAWLTSQEPVNLPGWESSRTDNDPKYTFGRFAQSLGGKITGDDVRNFVSLDPRWEIDPTSSKDDPRIRVKQEELNTWKPGHESRWQDVIRDSGPGGANAAQFMNSETRPGEGGSLDQPVRPNVMQNALSGVTSADAGDPNRILQQVMDALRANPQLAGIAKNSGFLQ
jgi:hypothetical protein